MAKAVLKTNLKGLKLVHSGKVRDIYEVDEQSLLFVATDRLSAFDVVMKNGIPDKGKILNQLSLFWFEMFSKNTKLPKHHVICSNVNKMPDSVRAHEKLLRGRSILVKKLNIIPVEAIIRGYITGSGWKEYCSNGTICSIKLPENLRHCEKLHEPIFTPSTKADIGGHDENIPSERVSEIIGEQRAKEIEHAALSFYNVASDFAKSRGIILADTKFEFGVDPSSGDLILADEVLTPDSSRFWDVDKYEVGRAQDSFDKQYVRDWLESISFDKTNPVEIPAAIVENTRAKYIEIYRRLVGREPEL